MNRISKNKRMSNKKKTISNKNKRMSNKKKSSRSRKTQKRRNYKRKTVGGFGGVGRISNTIGYGTIAYVASNRGGSGGGQGGTGESGQPVINAGGSILSGAPNGGAGGGPAVTANYLVSWGAYGTINGSLS